jgi:hypothetical protein
MVDDLHVSQTLSTPEGGEFLQAMRHNEQLINAVVALTAKEQFKIGFQAINAVKELKLHQNTLLWPSIFSGMGVIVDRETPEHRDSGGAISHFDFLLSAGNHCDAFLRVPDVASVFEYNPGTAVMLVGRALAHSVPRTWKGLRICLAHYMKDKVHDKVKVPRPPLVNMETYNGLKAPGYLHRVEGSNGVRQN